MALVTILNNLKADRLYERGEVVDLDDALIASLPEGTVELVTFLFDDAPVEPAEPVAPVAEPVAPVVEPVAPVVEPVVEPVVAPVVEPVAPVAEPVADPVVSDDQA